MMNPATSSELDTTWDLAPLFTQLNSDDFRAGMAGLDRELTELQELLDRRQIRRLAATPAVTDALVGDMRQVIDRVNRIALQYERLDCFLQGLVTTNSYDDAAQRELSRLEVLDTRRRQLDVRIQGWIGSLGSVLGDVMARDASLATHKFYLEETARLSKHLMSDELEALAAELSVDGGTAFGKLQGNVTSQLRATVELDGRQQELPVAAVHNLAFHPDAATRERGYRAELTAWHSVRTTVAASLNSVKGTAVTLARRRGWGNVVDVALEQNRIDRATCDALLGAIDEAKPMFRRYLRSKAQKLGHKQLPWWDLYAPLGKADREFTYPAARDFIVQHFGQFSKDLSDYARRAFDERWIDALPRDGKRGGAYCMGIMAIEESRILSNFDGSFDQVGTLAHELGHGYHNHCQRGLQPTERGAPMTLAETASIFCETIVANAASKEASSQERLLILDSRLSSATQVCLDIRSRYLFETAVIERRAGSQLAAEELCELMRAAQSETYGDAVAPETYHPYMWLWKPHYYSPDFNFYNFPYAFGHLFGLGLYAQFLERGEKFVADYVQLLRDTGRVRAVELAARFGIDIASRDFWRSSLAVVAADVDRFESLG
ncbi:MAG: M3 family oligoendopeptidase [Planctomycetes bacterium]|nr:M3 family oligoendopeptidase [Planctomycetota bacterium]